MSGVEGRSGGDRPSAPQNNPANISATGGAGQMGRQAATYIPGMNQLGSSGVETMAQQQGAPMYKAPDMAQLPELTPITAPTNNPDEHVMHGAPIGPGANNIPGLPQQVADPDIQQIQNYYPILQFWASQPGASQGTKDYVRYLGTIIPGAPIQ